MSAQTTALISNRVTPARRLAQRMALFIRFATVSTTLRLVAIVLGLSSCAPPILMKNPETHEVAQCYASGDLVRRWYDRDACVEKYQKLGWVKTEGEGN